MACLCAPTTHQGSFRCRFHRGSTSAQLASPPSPKGAFASSPPVPFTDLPCRAGAVESPSPSAAAPHQVNCNLLSSPPSSPPSPSSRTQSASSTTSPLSVPSRYAPRLPPAKRAISSSTALCRSLYPGSSKSELSAATAQSAMGRSASHAAALAIMKQHLHHNKHAGKSHNHVLSGRNMLRSSTGYKIGPSRLSRMGRPCTDQDSPLLKKVDCCLAATPSMKSTSSINSDEPQEEQLSSTKEAAHINFKMRSLSITKLKQSDNLSCKIVGYKAGPFIMSAVY